MNEKHDLQRPHQRNDRPMDNDAMNVMSLQGGRNVAWIARLGGGRECFNGRKYKPLAKVLIKASERRVIKREVISLFALNPVRCDFIEEEKYFYDVFI